jgi:hypothetical protein
MMTSRRQSAGQKANRLSKNVAEFKYLPTILTRQNRIKEEIRSM